MGCFLTKWGLYRKIDSFRTELLAAKNTDFNYSIVDICQKTPEIELRFVNFSTHSLKGMANVGRKPDQPHIILLNSNLQSDECDFYCTHEMIHTSFHKNEATQSFACFETVTSRQDYFLEWHANEGAAEIRMPYRTFISDVCIAYTTFKSWLDIDIFKRHMQRKYGVTFRMIEFRLESLKYEIYQCLHGVPIGEIEFMSHKEQQTRRIQIDSINSLQTTLAFNQASGFQTRN